MIHRSLILAFTFLVTVAQGPADPSLCEGSSFVTGTRGETRREGLARALRDVLVKRSGNPAFLAESRSGPLEGKATELVADYLYLDRMSDQPKHDEQGTRDRPYTLIARFGCEKIDAVLAELGDKAWLAPRPTLVPRVAITDNRHANFPLTGDGDPDERHRQALFAAATRYGMRIVLPTRDQVNGDMTVADSLVITGTLLWRDTDPGWAGDWHAKGIDWGIEGVSFDEAYRDLVLGAMAIASGHALPVGGR